VVRSIGGPDFATVNRFSRELDAWMRKARTAGLGTDDIEAIYQAALRDSFSEGVA